MYRIVLIISILLIGDFLIAQTEKSLHFKVSAGANSSSLYSNNEEIAFDYSGLGWHLNGQFLYGDIHKLKILFGVEKTRAVNDLSERINNQGPVNLRPGTTLGEPQNVDSRFLKLGGGVQFLLKHFSDFNIFIEPDLIYNLKLYDEVSEGLDFAGVTYKTQSHLAADIGIQVQHKKLFLGCIYERSLSNLSKELDFLNKEIFRLEIGYLF